MATLSEGSVIFADNTHNNSFLEALFQQKQISLYCDVVLKVCGRDISAHSNVLAAASPYFTTVLQQDVPRGFSQKNPQVIEIQIQGNEESTKQYQEVVNALVDFMYTGEVKMKKIWLEKVIEMAKIMRLDKVVTFCEKKTISEKEKLFENEVGYEMSHNVEESESDIFSDFVSSSEESEPEITLSMRGRPRKKRSYKDIGLGAKKRKLRIPLKLKSKRQKNEVHENNYPTPKNVSLERRHMCEQCGYSTGKLSHFKRHKLQHLPKEERALHEPFKEKTKICDVCDFKTSDTYKLKRHILTHESSGKHKCDQCDYTTRKLRELNEHKRKHQHEQNICSYCNIRIESPEDFDEHLQKHAGAQPYLCPYCDMRFKTRGQYKLHYPKHLDQKPFICEICSAGFKWKHALKNHMITHSDTKEHLCDQCGYATAHKSQLKAHRLIHTGETYKCSYAGCYFQATKKQNIKYHELTHTREKPHQCETCGQSFSLVKNMRRHMLLHSGSKGQACEHCDFTTHRFDKLREHLLKQHNIGEPPTKRVTVQQAILAAKVGEESVLSRLGSNQSQTVSATLSNHRIEQNIVHTANETTAAISQVLQFDNQPIILQHHASGQTYAVLQNPPMSNSNMSQATLASVQSNTYHSTVQGAVQYS